jgi:two-component system NtrC family sensor kinase
MNFPNEPPPDVESPIGSAPLRAILDAIPTPVVFYDRDHNYRYVNPSYAALVAREIGEIIGRPARAVLNSETWVQLQPYAERALSGENVQHAAWVLHADGSQRYLKRTYSPHRTPQGGIDGYFVVVRDLTDLKLRERELEQRQAELEASEAINAAIIASALDCVVVIDLNACVVAFNAMAERTFGYTASEVIGRPISDLIIPPHLRQRHTEGFRRYLATGAPVVLGRRVEVEAMRKDGSVLPVELAITEVKLRDRRLFTAYLRDLTETRAAAAEIEKQREVLHQREKLAALGSLLAGVAHELNNPLSIVIGQALMLREQIQELENEPAAAGAAERADKIQVAAERCARIVRTFLAMARQRKAERREVRPPTLIEAALDLLAYGLRSGGVEITRDWPDDLPPVYGDADQLHQVVVNLLINAQQALEERPSGRKIVLRMRADAAAAQLVLSVSDNGGGVPEEIRARIFDPYFTTKPMGVGTGVGLAISRGMVEAHGGSLTLLPAMPGEGATFEIRLPLDLPEEAAVDAAAGAAAPPRSAGGTDRRALIIDDEPEIAGMLAEILTRDGYACDLAGSGRAARERLAAVTETHYHAVLCDLRMPEEDGPTLFRWLEQEHPAVARRVIFVTGDTLGPATGRFLAASSRPVIEKPFVPSEIRRLVNAVGGPASA